MCPSCYKVVFKLYPCCLQVVSKLSPSCVQVVVESKILWRPKHFFSRRSPSPLTPVDVNTSIACALQRPKGFPLYCNQYTKVTKKECKMLKSFKTKRKIQILKHSIIVAFKLLKSAIAFTKKHGLEAKQTKLHNIVSKATSWDLLLIFF